MDFSKKRKHGLMKWEKEARKTEVSWKEMSKYFGAIRFIAGVTLLSN